MFYSETTKGFYSNLSRYTTLPDDLVAITKEEHRALLDAESQGQEIGLGANGRPEARPRVDPPGQVIKFRKGSVRKHINDEAIAQGFESILDAISYANEPTEPTRQTLGIALREWRSACMVVVDAALDGPGQPPNPQALIASLPDFVAP